MKKNTNIKPIVGAAYELKGTVDISAMLFTIGFFLSVLFIMALVLVIILMGWDPEDIAFIGCILLGVFLFIEGWVALGVYLVNRKSYIRIDETGIFGKGKIYGKLGLKLKEFSYSWKEMKKIDFAYENLENQIVITTTKDETFAYSFTYRFVKHKEVLEAIRTCSNADLLDNANIKEVEESYSPRSLILKGIGLAVLFILYGIFKLYLRGKL